MGCSKRSRPTGKVAFISPLAAGPSLVMMRGELGSLPPQPGADNAPALGPGKGPAPARDCGWHRGALQGKGGSDPEIRSPPARAKQSRTKQNVAEIRVFLAWFPLGGPRFSSSGLPHPSRKKEEEEGSGLGVLSRCISDAFHQSPLTAARRPSLGQSPGKSQFSYGGKKDKFLPQSHTKQFLQAFSCTYGQVGWLLCT